MTPCQNEIILETNNAYRKVEKNGSSVITVDKISYHFHKGSIYNIVGPSGSGKSSLLRLLNRLDEATNGEILCQDKSIKEIPPTQLRKKVSMLFQTPFLFDTAVRENLLYGCYSDENALERIIQQVGLNAEFLDKRADDLSGGEKQRVALARALLLEPEVLLLDEPTSSLDPALSETIEKLILQLVSEFCLTAIIVTHNPRQALRLGGETLLLVAGKLVESGPTRDVLTNPQSESGRKYLNREMQ